MFKTRENYIWLNISIAYEIERSVNISSYPTVKLTKHVDVDQYKYCIGYGIGFDRKGSYSNGNEVGRNVILFGVDISSSPHLTIRKKIF